MNKKVYLDNQFSNLSNSKGCYYFSDGKYSLHDLLAYLLEFSGPANVLISSYGISESAIRLFLRLKEEGLIKSLRCLFDFSVKSQKSNLLYFANNVADEICLASNHSKIIIIEGTQRNFVVITSANFTVNPRYECGHITSDIEIIKYFKIQLTSAFIGAIPLTYE